MFPVARRQVSEALSVTLLCLNFGLFLVCPLFGASRHPTDAGWGQPTSEQEGQLTEETLKSTLQTLQVGVNKIQENGSTTLGVRRDMTCENPIGEVPNGQSPGGL